MPIATIQRYDVTRSSKSSSIVITPSYNGVSIWNLDTPLSIGEYGEYTIYATKRTDIIVKMWGAAAGFCIGPGGAGGFTRGTISLTPNVNYKLIIGEAGKSPTGNTGRSGSGGGGGTAFTSEDLTPILVAGGGGGVAGARSTLCLAGGGLTGQLAESLAYGQPGTQTGPGVGGAGGRRTGSPGSGRNGGNGSGTWGIAAQGGRGFGNGGAGLYDGGDAGAGGGGGGYYGGGGGGGDAGAFPGGGGSGYINTLLVIDGLTEIGVGSTPANNSDAYRLNSGSTVDSVAQDGRIIISLAE